MKITAIDPAALLLPHLLCRMAGHAAPPPWFRLSGLGWCPEKQYLHHEGKPEAPTRPDNIRKQQFGQAIEAWRLADAAAKYRAPIENQQATVALMVERVTGSEYERLYFLGHIDGTIRIEDRTFIIDSKATSGFAYKKYLAMDAQALNNERTIKAYKSQVGAYAIGLSADGGMLAFRNRDTNSYENVWDDQDYSWTLAELMPAVMRGLENYFLRDVRDVEPWECRFCGFADHCQKRKTEAPPTNEGYELLTQYRAADKHFRNQSTADFASIGEMEDARAGIDKILDKARKNLKELQPADWKPFHDGFKLSFGNRLTITDTQKEK